MWCVVYMLCVVYMWCCVWLCTRGVVLVCTCGVVCTRGVVLVCTCGVVCTRGVSVECVLSSLLFSSLLFSCLVSLLTCLFLFFFSSLFSFLSSLFSFIFSFIFSFCTHRDDIRQTSDSTNYERSCTTRSTESRESHQSVKSLLCHILGSFRVLSQIKPQAPLLVGLIFMFNVLSALPGFSQEILCIAKLMTANCSAECPTQHMWRSCGAEDV